MAVTMDVLEEAIVTWSLLLCLYIEPPYHKQISTVWSHYALLCHKKHKATEPSGLKLLKPRVEGTSFLNTLIRSGLLSPCWNVD